MPESPQAPYRYDGYVGYRWVRLTFILYSPFFPQWFIAQGLKPDVYYEAAAVIITLILLGRLLENRAKGQTSEAIHRWVCRQRRRVIRNGREMDVPL